MTEQRPYLDLGDIEPCKGSTKRAKKLEKAPTPALRRQIKEQETQRMRDRKLEIEKRTAARVQDADGTIQRSLTLDKTKIRMANAQGIRSYVEIPIPKSQLKEQTRVAGHQMSSESLRVLIGIRHIDLYKTVTIEESKKTQGELVHEIRAGRLDAGITTGIVSEKHLRDGKLTVFSPLHYGLDGVTIVPDQPVTIIARTPQGGKKR